MAGDDIAVIRAIMEAFNDRDAERMVALTHPDGEVYPMRAQLEGTSYRGHDGIRQMMVDLFDDWESVQMDSEEFVQGPDGTAVLGRLRGCGRASGVDVDVPVGWVWRLRDGKAVYAKAFSNQEDALRAAGVDPA